MKPQRTIRLIEIIPGKLYQRGHMKDYTKEEKRQVIAKYGLTTVVNLYAQEDPDIKNLIQEDIWMPIADGKVYEPEKILALARALAKGIQYNDKKVLVHCWGGKNRSALVNTIICTIALHMRTDEAIAYMRSKRKGSLSNPHFVEWLKELE
jgi:protein-tyrosine phosphatase